MSAAEIEAYLREMSDGGSDSDINEVSDCEDEEWVPQSISKIPASDNEESENTENDDVEQQEAELYSSESEEDIADIAQPEGYKKKFLCIIKKYNNYVLF